MLKITQLFKSDNVKQLKNLGVYIYKAFDKRRLILQNI